MRSWFSTIRRSLAVVCLGAAVAVPAVAADSPAASAALMPVVGCGFHFGPISNQGAAGTVFYSVQLLPASPAQRCTTTVSFAVSATPTRASGARYTTIDDNPSDATQTVSFAPGRLPPALTIAWALFHCADPAVPGLLTFAAHGLATSTPITPTTCGPVGSPHSRFESFPIPATPSAVGIAPTLDDHGYRTVSQTGALTNEGDATVFTTAASNSPAVDIASARVGNGAWVVAADGGVFTYGAAGFFGSLGALRLNQPVVGIAPTPTGHGYWMVASDGGVFAFGDAAFHGSLGAIRLNAPIVGLAAAPDGRGYWLVASDGGVFAFGSAAYAGSLGSIVLNAPVVGIAAGPHGGYWLVGSDGSVFAFGGVPFKGSLGAVHLNAPVSGMAATTTGNGYWLVGADNGIFTFGDAHFFGAAPVTFP